MASYKAEKSKLLKVGFEGFEMLEQAYPSPRQQKANKAAVTSSSATTAKSCVYKYQPPQTLVCQVSTDEMIRSYEAGTKYDYSKRKSAAVAY